MFFQNGCFSHRSIRNPSQLQVESMVVAEAHRYRGGRGGSPPVARWARANGFPGDVPRVSKSAYFWSLVHRFFLLRFPFFSLKDLEEGGFVDFGAYFVGPLK